MLVDGERFTSDGGLINLKVGILCDNATISRNNSAFLNLQDIARNDFGGLELLEGTVTENNGLEGERFLQLVDNRTGLEFLNETDSGVEK